MELLLTNLKWSKPYLTKQLASSLLGKDKSLNGIIVVHHHYFAALDVSDWVSSWWSYCSPNGIVTFSFSRAN